MRKCSSVCRTGDLRPSKISKPTANRKIRSSRPARDSAMCAFAANIRIGYGRVSRPRDSPVEISLEAFSPFIPLNVDDSSLPATVMNFTVKNISAKKIDAEIAGWIENVIGLSHTSQPDEIDWQQQLRRTRDNYALLNVPECTGKPWTKISAKRPEIVFEDFEKEDLRRMDRRRHGVRQRGPIERSRRFHNIRGDVEGREKTRRQFTRERAGR